jgi:hypothetical protein
MSKVADRNRAAVYTANDVALCHPVQHCKSEIERTGNLDKHSAETDRHGAATDENCLRQERGGRAEGTQQNRARAH